MNIVFLEAYYGGSHKFFLDKLENLLTDSVNITSFKLPARHWRRRLQGSHFKFASLLNNNYSPGPEDIIICSSLTDIGALKGLLKHSFNQCRFICFFHENQFAYPRNLQSSREAKIGQDIFLNELIPAIHLSQTLAADQLLFNSQYNQESLINGLVDFCKRRSLKSSFDIKKIIESKSTITYLPVLSNERLIGQTNTKEKRLLWNHRWEFDKDPRKFSILSQELLKQDATLSIDILGQNNRNPKLFDCLVNEFKEQISHFGHIKSRAEYFERLRKCTLLPVTSQHDFLGISVIEAISCGVIPLLPHRLAYPEIIAPELHSDLLYKNDEDFHDKATYLLNNGLSNKKWMLLNDSLKRFHDQEFQRNFLYALTKY